jgi:hypothetical protein
VTVTLRAADSELREAEGEGESERERDGDGAADGDDERDVVREETGDRVGRADRRSTSGEPGETDGETDESPGRTAADGPKAAAGSTARAATQTTNSTNTAAPPLRMIRAGSGRREKWGECKASL